MSIINDALKKAEIKKQLLQNKPFQHHLKMDELSHKEKKLRKWMIATSIGTVSLIAIFLLLNFFEIIESPFKKSNTFDSLAQAVLKAESQLANLETVALDAEVPPDATLGLRNVDFEIPLQFSNFRLSGILYDERKPLAIINNRIVEEGALVNKAELLEIQTDHVRLSLNGKEFTLKLQ